MKEKNFMKSAFKDGMIIVFIMIFMLIMTAVVKADSGYGDFGCVAYVRNYDGDTITVNIPNIHPLLGEKINIRIRGIDTPEIKAKCEIEKFMALDAKVFVENLCQMGKLTLRNISRGKYFRIVADVYVGDINIGEELIKSGLAVSYDGGTKKGWCK